MKRLTGRKGPLTFSLANECYLRFKAGLVPAFFCFVDASQGQDRGTNTQAVHYLLGRKRPVKMVPNGLLSDGFIIRAMSVANERSVVMIKTKHIYKSGVQAGDIRLMVGMVTSGDMALF
jgi:hypothetical protein